MSFAVTLIMLPAMCRHNKHLASGTKLTETEALIAEAIDQKDFESAKRILAQKKRSKEDKSNFGNLLLYTFERNDIHGFEFLLNSGVSPNIKGAKGRDIIFDLVIGHLPDIGVPTSSNDVRYLRGILSHGVKPNIYDEKSGETPLMVAIDQGDNAHIETLLKFGANPNIRDKSMGDTPVMRSAILNRFDITWLLIQSGGEYTATAPGSFSLMEILEKGRYTPNQDKPNEKVLARQKIISYLKQRHPNFKPYEEKKRLPKS